jgi:polysaccharide biosynthesis/export protein
MKLTHMRILYTTYSILGLLLILTSCSYKQNKAVISKKSPASAPIADSALIQNAIANISNYRIQPQDILQIRNLQNSKTIVDLTPALSNTSANPGAANTAPETFLVEDDGTVALTGLGHVQVAGLTRAEAAKHIEGLYKKDVLVNPIIDVKITNLKVTIMGEVKNPNNYPLVKDRSTLIEMIGNAGGFTEFANQKDVKIYRGNQTDTTANIIALNNLNSISGQRTILQNNDVIIVGKSQKTLQKENLQNIVTTAQPFLILLSTILVVLSITKR